MKIAWYSTLFVTLAVGALVMMSASDKPLAAAAWPQSDSRTPTYQQPCDGAPGAPQNMAQAQEAEQEAEVERVTLLPGTVISVRIADRVDSNKGHTGDLLTGTVDPSVIGNDKVLIPRGTEAHVRMIEDKKGGHLHGKAEVRLELVSLVMNGRKLAVESDAYTKEKGALAAKVEGAAPSSAGAAADVAVASDPGAVTNPVIAVFRAAKVELSPGSRVQFTLTAPFTFVKPPAASEAQGQPSQ
jgi:hypothetical protein